MLGILTGTLILFPPWAFLVPTTNKAIVTLGDPNSMHELLLIFEILILPPIIYESACLLFQKKVFNRIGTIMITQTLNVILTSTFFIVLIRLL